MKRFELQQDGLIGKYETRRRVVQNVIDKYVSAENSPIVGATLFGSLSKGKSRIGSDIDLAVFYDPAVAANRCDLNQEDFIRQLQPNNNDDRDIMQKRNEVTYRYESQIGAKITEELDLVTRAINVVTARDFVHVFPMNSFVVKDGVRAMAGEDSLQSKGDAATNFLKLFQLSVTQGVMVFRHQLLHECRVRGAEGEKIWRQILKYIVMHEHLNDWSDFVKERDIYPKEVTEETVTDFLQSKKLHYPVTLDEAIRVYGKRE